MMSAQSKKKIASCVFSSGIKHYVSSALKTKMAVWLSITESTYLHGPTPSLIARVVCMNKCAFVSFLVQHQMLFLTINDAFHLVRL